MTKSSLPTSSLSYETNTDPIEEEVSIAVSASLEYHDDGDTSTHSKTRMIQRIFQVIKSILSMVFILFCVVVVSTAICTKQTNATSESGVHPILAFFTFWVSLMWLALLEGALNCTVGLQPINKDMYSGSHPKTYKCTNVSHRGDNIERFIVGRQYLDLMIVFITSFMVTAIDDASVLGLPQIVNDIFLGSDLAVIICTIVFGQLIAQINSAPAMLDFMNNWIIVASTYIALCVEMSGILHAVYFLQWCLSKAAGKKPHSNEPPKSPIQKIFFWFRVVMSMGMCVFAITVFMTALLGGNTPVNDNIPKSVSIISLLLLLFLGGFMEALQIAMMRVKYLPSDQIESSPTVSRNLDLIFERNNLEPFLVGRQIAQTVIMFLIARIITVDMQEGEDNLFGVSDGTQAFFNSGLLNALVSTIFASLCWRVTANEFPMVFLSSPIAIWILRLCLWVKATGICDAAWIFAMMHQWIARYRPDAVYLAKAGLDVDVDHDDIEKGGELQSQVTKSIDTSDSDEVSVEKVRPASPGSNTENESSADEDEDDAFSAAEA